MLRRIAVHLEHHAECQRRLGVALQLAKQHQAELVGIYADDSVPDMTVRDAVLSATSLRDLSQQSEAAEAEARTGFEAAAAEAEVATDWRADLRRSDVSIAAYTRCTDLLIMGQDRPSRDASPNNLVERVVMSAGKPVLVVPFATNVSTVGKRVLYCWDQGQESTRALADALPLARQAEAMFILTMDDKRPGHNRDAADLLPDLIAYCEAHGAPTPRHIERDTAGVGIGETILNVAADQSADLIVMGAYGHSRLREWVLGGATISILRHMTVPILFSH